MNEPTNEPTNQQTNKYDGSQYLLTAVIIIHLFITGSNIKTQTHYFYFTNIQRLWIWSSVRKYGDNINVLTYLRPLFGHFRNFSQRSLKCVSLLDQSIWISSVLNDVFVAGLPGLVPVHQQRPRSLQYARASVCRSHTFCRTCFLFPRIFFSENCLVFCYSSLSLEIPSVASMNRILWTGIPRLIFVTKWHVTLLVLLFRPPVYGSNGRSHKMLVMFFSFFILSPRVLRGPSADRLETWPHGRKLAEFYNPSPKIRGPSPKKIWGQKHAKFRSILYNLRLWSQISPERLKISKIGKIIFPDRFLLSSVKKVRWTLAHKLQRSW